MLRPLGFNQEVKCMTINEIESLAKKIKRQCEEDGEPVTIEEAREMATLELKARHVNRVGSDTEKKKPVRVRKVDATKGMILKEVQTLLESLGATDTALNNEVELSFNYNNDNYSLRLVKHRAKKGA
jgi:predicted acyltransferase (DUF342 family)